MATNLKPGDLFSDTRWEPSLFVFGVVLSVNKEGDYAEGAALKYVNWDKGQTIKPMDLDFHYAFDPRLATLHRLAAESDPLAAVFEQAAARAHAVTTGPTGPYVGKVAPLTILPDSTPQSDDESLFATEPEEVRDGQA